MSLIRMSSGHSSPAPLVGSLSTSWAAVRS
jgi:hypothetical protein